MVRVESFLAWLETKKVYQPLWLSPLPDSNAFLVDNKLLPKHYHQVSHAVCEQFQGLYFVYKQVTTQQK
jgi:hypothetical protein